MSDAETDTENPTATPEPAKRGELLELLETDIREAHRKATSGRVYNAENEKVRQGWFRVHGYLAGQYRQLARDAELEDLRAELDTIKDEYGFET